jgi:predicted amidophosphoribosyltransferase
MVAGWNPLHSCTVSTSTGTGEATCAKCGADASQTWCGRCGWPVVDPATIVARVGDELTQLERRRASLLEERHRALGILHGAVPATSSWRAV